MLPLATRLMSRMDIFETLCGQLIYGSLKLGVLLGTNVKPSAK
jgi:hypothetical protein